MQIIETKNSVGPGNVVLIEMETPLRRRNCSADLAVWEQALRVLPRGRESARTYLASGAVAENIWPINFYCRLRWQAEVPLQLRNSTCMLEPTWK